MSENIRTTNDGLVFQCDNPQAQQYAQQVEERHKAGRYKLVEAAQRLEAEAGERADVMLKKLMAAAESGDLPVYGPGENARYLYGPGNATHAREYYEEARWNELNEWLKKKEPYIKYQFQDPGARTATAVSSPSATKPGVPSAEIIEKFHLGREWENRLRHRQSYSYLKPPVLGQPGARGNGKGKNLWNPARFAKMLMVEHGKNQKAMDTIMKNPKNQFADWLDEWHEISGWNDV